MLLQADIFRAAHEGTVNEQQYGEGVAIGKAYMNTIKNKSTLSRVIDFMVHVHQQSTGCLRSLAT